MHPYIPSTPEDRKAMLETVGARNIEALFSDIPEAVRYEKPLALDPGMSEQEIGAYFDARAEENDAVKPCFLGGGSYDHLIPSVVGHMTGISEFYTSYTPYQPEISQGTLQMLFEYQTMIADLSGMDVANASMYDGGTALMEAAMLATTVGKKKKIVVSEGVFSSSREILKTYAHARGIEIVEIPMKDGITDLEATDALYTDDAAGLIVQSPNRLGFLEDIAAYEPIAHRNKKASLIVSADPWTLGTLKRPGDLGADIYVGEGQSLGLGMNFGGPYLGILAVKEPYLRKMPGRLVGETVDMDGKRAFVLTLSAREQHIRREKATSNICSNEGLMTLAASVYLALIGKNLRKANLMAIAKAHRLYEAILAIPGFEKVSDADFFSEFAVRTKGAKELQAKLYDAGFHAGLYAGDDMVTFAVTEARTDEEIDALIEAIGGVSA